ncbi:YfcC family protein [Egicoccus sp. AB-alg2]|uniref:YfcC family protein n=1 Tax=Egicoccus sp. AB-alg2 TaxID=3242693 RepID=UPI00359E726B
MSTATTPTPARTEPPPPPKRLRFPSAFTVLFGVTVAVWLLAFLIPTGRYAVDPATGGPVPGSYERVDVGLSFTDRLYELFMAPVNGLYGVQSSETGYIGAYEAGELFGAAGVFLFVLAIGIFITMTMRSGAIEAGISRIGERFGGRAVPLIVVLMVIFAIGGTTEGMAEETLGFYGLVVPLVLSLGYDRLTAAGVIILGAGVGTLASTVNPFATGAASAAAGISISDGIGLRALMFVVLTAVTIAYVVRYARRVGADPSRSLVGFREEDAHVVASAEKIEMTRRHRLVLWLMGGTFAMMVFAIVPWAQILVGPEADSYTWQLDWYFPELAALFLVMAVVIGLVSGLGEKGMTDTIAAGAGDFIAAGLIIVLARGVTVIMNNSMITDTILNTFESAVSGTSSALFGAVMFVVNVPLAFLVPSSSGHATLAMPVLAPLADFAGVGREIVVTAYQSASGWMNLFTPTSAVVMGGLALAGVGYHKFLRFIAPLLGILFVLVLAFVAIGAAIG